MLKKLVIVLAGFALAYPAAAQPTTVEAPKPEASFAKMEFGLHAGPGYSVFFNQNPRLSPRNGKRPPFGSVVAGMSYQYNFTKNVGLHAEVNYERKGDIYYLLSSYNQGTYINSHAYDRINYITVPVMARFTFGKSVRFFVNGGMYAGLTISARRITNDSYYTPGADVAYKKVATNTDITNDIRQMDAGVVMGAGVLLPVGKVGAFTLEARNNTGFIHQDAKTDLYIGHFYNNATNLMVGFTFYLDRIKTANLKMSK